MNKFYSFLLMIGSLSPVVTSAQYFERVYSGLNMSMIGSLDNTVDSGFIICGTKDGGFLMKLQSSGDTEWTKSDSGMMQHAAAVIQDAAGNFLAIGSGPSQQGNSQAVLSTYDANGNLVSENSIPPVNALGTWGTTIVRSHDRQMSQYCYYTNGYTADNYYTLDNGQVIGGDLTYVGINSISIDNQGNYYAAANLEFDLDSLFNWRNNVLVLSGNHFPRTQHFYDTRISSSAITSDGNAMLCGLYDSIGTKYIRLMKFNSSSNLLWSCFIPDTGIYSVHQISETTDGGFAILCAGNDGSNQNIVFYKVDANGTMAWKKQFNGNGSSFPKNFRVLADGYVILGESSGDPYVIRTDNMGNTGSTGVLVTENEENTITLFPNPSAGVINISSAIVVPDGIAITVFDIQGRSVFNTVISLPVQQVDLTFLAKGVYHFKAAGKNAELKCGKFVIE